MLLVRKLFNYSMVKNQVYLFHSASISIRNIRWPTQVSNMETYGQARDASQPIRTRDFTGSSLCHIIKPNINGFNVKV